MLFAMDVDRDSEQCGPCHIRGDVSGIPASNGFTRHHEQWNELATSQHRSLDCVDCHNPHQSAKYTDNDWNPNTGIISACEDCHWQEAQVANTDTMGGLECKDCHMPPMSKSAIGDVANFTGDVAGHLFSINPDTDAEQFSDDGGQTNPYITLDYSCRWCHRPDGAGPGGVKTDEELEESATGYHTPQPE